MEKRVLLRARPGRASRASGMPQLPAEGLLPLPQHHLAFSLDDLTNPRGGIVEVLQPLENGLAKVTGDNHDHSDPHVVDAEHLRVRDFARLLDELKDRRRAPSVPVNDRIHAGWKHAGHIAWKPPPCDV